MTCYFHQNLAYIAFKTYDQMIFACRLRLYTDEDRLITGKLRLSRSLLSQSALQVLSTDTHPKAMNYQFMSPTDLNMNNQPSNNYPKQRKA